MSLKTEQNTASMERRVRNAFRAFATKDTHDFEYFNAVFEHGQWWIVAILTEETDFDDEGEKTYSVVDAEGGDSVDGFGFEEV
jgi:hypothetical protein